jgi:hypothetical protein
VQRGRGVDADAVQDGRGDQIILPSPLDVLLAA